MISTYVVKVTTTGNAGSATGSATTTKPINGRLLGVYLDFHASAPATTDTTVTCVFTGNEASVTKTLLTKANSATDAWFYPRLLLDDEAGADLTAVYDSHPLDGYVTVSLAQCDALTNAVVGFIVVEEIR